MARNIVVDNEAEQLAVEAFVSDEGVKEGPLIAILRFLRALVRTCFPADSASPEPSRQAAPSPSSPPMAPGFLSGQARDNPDLLAFSKTISFSIESSIRASELLKQATAAPATVFDVPQGTQASVSVATFVDRFVQYAEASVVHLVCASILLDRFVMQSNVPLTRANAYGLFTAAFLVSSKSMDRYYSNRYIGTKVAGLKDPESVNRMEISFLRGLDSSLFISSELYNHYFGAAQPMAQLVLAARQAPIDLTCHLVRQLRFQSMKSCSSSH